MIRPVSEQPQHPLTDENAMFLLRMMQYETADEDITDELQQDPMAQLITRRAAFHNMRITPQLIAVLTVFSEGIPGRAVQLLHAMAVGTNANQPASIQDFCVVFGGGLPSDKGFIDAWNAQKGIKGENLLDTFAWERRA